MYSDRLVFLVVAATSISRVVTSFSIAPQHQCSRRNGMERLMAAPDDQVVPAAEKPALSTTDSTTSSSTSSSPPQSSTITKSRFVPLTWDEMIRQAVSCMKDAAAAGETRQIIRMLMPRDATGQDLLRLREQDANFDADTALLVPPDESWQGGIMQLYRAAEPTATQMVRGYTTTAARRQDGGVPPRINADRSVDESGVDGVGLVTAADGSCSCWVQPTQENVESMERMAAAAADDDVVALLNPQWRMVDDILDTVSKGEEGGFWSNLASALGGKGNSLRRIQAAGYVPVYTLEGYVCRGANVRILQTYGSGSEWSVYCEKDEGNAFVPVGASPSRPTYQEVERMLNDANIGYKYARDLGMEPKL